MITLGICLGLLAATIQSISYLYSRAYSLKQHKPSSVQLLVISHSLMGIISLILLPFFWNPLLNTPSNYLFPLAAACLPYLFGQTAFFFALKLADSSRVSPLLGLKVIFVAFLSLALNSSSTSLTPMQWLAVTISALAAFLFSYSGKKLPLPAIVAMLITVSFYAVSDIFIIALIKAVNPTPAAPPTVHTIILASILCYLFCGLASLILLPKFGSKTPSNWTSALPFSITWYVSMFLFFICLGWTGAVLGNITMSSRVIIPIILGYILARAGHHHLEQHTPAPIIIRRAIAAAFMIAAFALYLIGT